MSLTALQAASVITCHEFATKFLVTGLYRLYTWLGPNKDEYKNSRVVRDLCAAQLNCSEYSAILAAVLFYFAASGGQTVLNPMGALLAVGGQIGYFWSRVLTGYPNIPTASFATARYFGFLFICVQLVGLSFGNAENGNGGEL